MVGEQEMRHVLTEGVFDARVSRLCRSAVCAKSYVVNVAGFEAVRERARVINKDDVFEGIGLTFDAGEQAVEALDVPHVPDVAGNDQGAHVCAVLQ
jgi:hypothetical protein